MIVWGGTPDGINDLNTGGRYDPTSDSWVATSTSNAPSARDSHTAVWTGSDMIVWGGSGDLNTGGRYSPEHRQLDGYEYDKRTRWTRPAHGSVDRQRDDRMGWI